MRGRDVLLTPSPARAGIEPRPREHDQDLRVHSTGGADDAGDGSAPENACREATPAHGNGYQQDRLHRTLASFGP